ncbi:hypothetical protein EW146_g3156 [Bondarzewia mesenterica]|uniref:Steroid 5-alpha reductase C-terminal domain-containing protein n=1 Tax=Bondarzewia mesenterica TaxID=1095465 RepID=A0A4S4LYI3_9AGAM|nr:hypothetical protein EW146_g3156 [Bondarzewia mesenterica]
MSQLDGGRSVRMTMARSPSTLAAHRFSSSPLLCDGTCTRPGPVLPRHHYPGDDGVPDVGVRRCLDIPGACSSSLPRCHCDVGSRDEDAQFDKITDFTGGSNFFLLGASRRCVPCGVAARLTWHRECGDSAPDSVDREHVLCAEHRRFLLFRVLKMGSDARFNDIRSHFFTFMAFWIVCQLRIFVDRQVWTVSLPVVILNSPAVSDPARGGSNPAFGTSKDIAGIVIWSLGWVIETVADAQKFYHKSTKPPKNQPNTYGIWGWSRHPPYFGEILCWWGIWILSISPSTNGSLPSSARSAQYGAVVSPLFTTVLLLFASGIPTAEKPSARRFYLMSLGPRAKEEDAGAWAEYKAYLASTSILVPLPSAVYRRLPEFVKRTVLLDLPMYKFDERTDGPGAIEEERRKLEEQEA